MKKIIKEEESVLVCDVTGEELMVDYSLEEKNQKGATILLNTDYGCTFDGSKFYEIHVSETVLKDILWMLKKNYGRDTEFMKEVYELYNYKE